MLALLSQSYRTDLSLSSDVPCLPDLRHFGILIKNRVARFLSFDLFSRAKKQIWLFKLVGLKIFENLLSSWPFLESIEVCIVNAKFFLS